MIVFHHLQKPVDGIHVPYSFEYPDATSRTTASGFEIDDIGKLAIQHDDQTLWMLVEAVAVSWIQVSLSQSAIDKVNLADLGQTSFSNFIVDGVTVSASESEDTISFTHGQGIQFSSNPAQKTIEISASIASVPGHNLSHIVGGNDVIPSATSTKSGLMSPTDKQKLTGLKPLVPGDNISLEPEGDSIRISSSGGTGASDHGALTGLGDDDHPQYMNTARHDASHVLGGNIPHDTLANLTDVAIVAPAESQVLGYVGGVWKNIAPATGGDGVTDHGLLSGREDDDHPQYLNSARHTLSSHMLGSNIPHDTLANLTDVTITSPAESQALRYVDGQWRNVAPSDGVTDHSLLAHLSTADDHTQYVHLSNQRTLSARHMFAGGLLVRVPPDYDAGTSNDTDSGATIRTFAPNTAGFRVYNMEGTTHEGIMVQSLSATHAAVSCRIAGTAPGPVYYGLVGGDNAFGQESTNNDAKCALFQIYTPSNSAVCVTAQHRGLGSAMLVQSTNVSNTSPTLSVSSTGVCWGLNVSNSNAAAKGINISLPDGCDGLVTSPGVLSKFQGKTISSRGAEHWCSSGTSHQGITCHVYSGAAPSAALAIYSDSETVSPDGVRWGIYCTHKGSGAAILGVPRGTQCYAGIEGAVKEDSASTAMAGFFTGEKTTATAPNLYTVANGVNAAFKSYHGNVNSTAIANDLVNKGKGTTLSCTRSNVGSTAPNVFIKNNVSNDPNSALYVYGAGSASGQPVVKIENFGAGPYAMHVYSKYTASKGVYIEQSAAAREALKTLGGVNITGTLTKTAGTFKIDHPLDPMNKFLSHSFVESPDMLNIYNGAIQLDEQGEGTVLLPSYFGALNDKFRYQLTAVGCAMPELHVSEKMNANQFRISGGKPNAEVEWQVTGVRKDVFALANPVKVEEEKEVPGYTYPELYS